MTRSSGHGLRRTLLACALPISVLAALAIPTSATAAPAFLSTDQVSSDVSTNCIVPGFCTPTIAPVVAMDADDNSVMAWTEPDGVNRKLVYRYRPAGGVFSAQQTLDSSTIIQSVQAAFDGSGNLTLAWSRTDTGAGTSSIVSATRAMDGTVSPPTPVVTFATPFILPIDLSVGRAGDAVIAYSESGVVKAATRPAGGTFGPADPVASATPAMAQGVPPTTAVDSEGNVIVTWIAITPPTSTFYYAAYKPAGGAFPAAADELDSGGNYFNNDVAFDGAGNATAMWVDGIGTPASEISVAEKPKSDATFGNGVPVAGNMTGAAALAVVDDGRAIVAFTRNSAAETASRPAGGTFGTPQPIAGTTNVFGVNVALSRSGKGLLATNAILGAAQVRELSVTGPGSVVKDYPFSAGGGSVTPPAVDADGNGIVASTTVTSAGGGGFCPIPVPGCIGGSGTEKVFATGFDASGPRLRSLQTPDTGLTGASLPFSVNPVDVWSSVASTNWAFGDSQSSSDASTNHTYSASGDYTATVTSTDSLGNTSTESRSVKVTDPIPPSNGGGTPPPSTPQGPAGDVVKPVLSSLSMTRTKFAVASGATAVNAAAKKKTPKGSAFRFSLSEAAKVQIVIEQKTIGRRSGSKCVKATKKNAKAKKCTLYVKRGTLTRSGKANGNNVPFTGRIGKKALKVGSYRATLVATDAAGNTSVSRSVTFKIAR